MISTDYRIVHNELYNIVKGKIISDNGNDTYDVEVHGNIYPRVKNIGCDRVLKVDELVSVGLEFECKKMPIIIGDYVEG